MKLSSCEGSGSSVNLRFNIPNQKENRKCETIHIFHSSNHCFKITSVGIFHDVFIIENISAEQLQFIMLWSLENAVYIFCSYLVLDLRSYDCNWLLYENIKREYTRYATNAVRMGDTYHSLMGYNCVQNLIWPCT